jgi:hypothetical protein
MFTGPSVIFVDLPHPSASKYINYQVSRGTQVTGSAFLRGAA